MSIPSKAKPEPGVHLSLRGADISPVKRRHMDYLAMLEMQLFRKRHLIEADLDAETLIVDNIEGTLLGFLHGVVAPSQEEAHRSWNVWKSDRANTDNKELADFAVHTLIDISYLSRASGLLDLREKPRARKTEADLLSAWEGVGEWGEGAGDVPEP